MEEKHVHQWQTALTLWSKFLKLKDPTLCTTSNEEKKEGLSGSFAMIRLNDHAVVLSLRQIQELGLGNDTDMITIMAHEIGHHIYCPADLADQGRLLARTRSGLPSKEALAPLIANLYSDLLINDKLKRDFNLPVDRIYQVIGKEAKDEIWVLYMRIYEILWGLPKGTLVTPSKDEMLEADAQLANRLVRTFSRDWLKGAGRFAAICLPYLMKNNGKEIMKIYSVWNDTRDIGRGGEFPQGLTDIDPDEVKETRHPALDEAEDGSGDTPANQNSNCSSQHREPFEYGQILESMGLKFNQKEMLYQYYKEKAMPYLIPFPSKKMPAVQEPLLEGIEPWSIGSPIEAVDWFESILRSPRIVPGYTTVEQTFGTDSGGEPQKEPIDLDIYVDSSGSMPNPSYQLSYLALAGTIIVLSALRAGAKVQATLWSGTREFKTTPGFIRDEKDIIAVITGFIGGSTAFPIHILRDTYQNRPPNSRKVHILVISDEGVTTIFNKDEKGNDGTSISEMALKNCGGGGTFVLNLYQQWKNDPLLVLADKQGWDIHSVSSWEELTAFARKFSSKQYEEKS